MVCALVDGAKRLNKSVLHVQESGLFRVKPEVAEQVGKHVLAEALRKTKGVEADQRLESGDVGKKIGQVAEKEGYDMIVMGGKGHGGQGSWWHQTFSLGQRQQPRAALY